MGSTPCIQLPCCVGALSVGHRWHKISVGKGRLVSVCSLFRRGGYGGTYMWLDVLQGLGRVFSGVLSPCGGPGLVFSCGYPMWVAGCLDMRRGVEKSVITQVYSAPDDGCKGRPKHVEHTCSC